MAGKYDYIDLGYEPRESDVVVTFYLEPHPEETFESAANKVAAESSIGTWTDVKTMLPEIYEKLRPHIFEMDKESGIIKIAYPAYGLEAGNMPGILAGIAGNIFGMKAVQNLRLLWIDWPEEIVREYKGPLYGIEGVRKFFGVYDRPLLGTIVKPKVGLPPDKFAEVAYHAWRGGLDVVKDDENLVGQKFCPFEDRLYKMMEKKDLAEEETGEKKGYMVNITAPWDEMIKRAEMVEDAGNEYVMLDVVVLGFSAVQAFRNYGFEFIIHAHRAMHGAITKNPKHGIKMSVLARIYRMLGVDQLHVGTAVGKMAEGKEDVFDNVHAVRDSFYHIKPTFPVASGGLHPGLLPDIVEIFGKDVIIQAGGGVHGHPEGTEAGARAMRQAAEAVLEGVTLEEYAKDHRELALALEKWGRRRTR